MNNPMRIVITGTQKATADEKRFLEEKAVHLLKSFPGSILVSSHGTGAEEGALRAAQKMSEETGRPVSDFLEEIIPCISQERIEQYYTKRAGQTQPLLPVDVNNLEIQQKKFPDYRNIKNRWSGMHKGLQDICKALTPERSSTSINMVKIGEILGTEGTLDQCASLVLTCSNVESPNNLGFQRMRFEDRSALTCQLAMLMDIPIVNIRNPKDKERLNTFIVEKKLKQKTALKPYRYSNNPYEILYSRMASEHMIVNDVEMFNPITGKNSRYIANAVGEPYLNKQGEKIPLWKFYDKKIDRKIFKGLFEGDGEVELRNTTKEEEANFLENIRASQLALYTEMIQADGAIVPTKKMFYGTPEESKKKIEKENTTREILDLKPYKIFDIKEHPEFSPLNLQYKDEKGNSSSVMDYYRENNQEKEASEQSSFYLPQTARFNYLYIKALMQSNCLLKKLEGYNAFMDSNANSYYGLNAGEALNLYISLSRTEGFKENKKGELAEDFESVCLKMNTRYYAPQLCRNIIKKIEILEKSCNYGYISDEHCKAETNRLQALVKEGLDSLRLRMVERNDPPKGEYNILSSFSFKSVSIKGDSEGGKKENPTLGKPAKDIKKAEAEKPKAKRGRSKKVKDAL